MTDLPDYVGQPDARVHTEPPRSAQWQNMSEDQLQALRARLIESIIQIVVQAARGFFIPTGTIGGAFEQLEDWAESILGQDFLEGDWASLLTGLLTGSQPLNALGLFGNLPSILFSNVPISVLAPPRTLPMMAGTFPDSASVSGGGVWVFDPTVSKTADGTGSMRVTANGTTRAIRGDMINVSDGQKIEPSMFVKWFNYVGAGPTVELHVVKFDSNGSEIGTELISAITPTAGSASGWTELTGSYLIASNVDQIRLRFAVTAGATAGRIHFDEGTYEVRSNFVDNITNWFRLPNILELFTDPAGFNPSALFPVPLQNAVDQIFQAITGFTRFDNLLEEMFDALKNIPFFNILGVGGPANIGDAIMEAVNQLVGGFVNMPGTGASFADLFNIGNWVSAGANLGRFAFDILGITNNKSMWDGLLPTSTASVPLTQVGSGASPGYTFGVTSSTATTAYKRFTQAIPLGVISWLGGGTTNISDMRVNVYKVDPSDGTRTLAHASANIIANVGTATDDWNTYEIPDPIAIENGDTYGAEIEVRTGTGTHTVVGQQQWLKNHPTVLPRRMQSVRNPVGTTPPSTIAEASITYSNNHPWVEWGVETGTGVEYHEPQVLTFMESSTLVIPAWANFVDRVILPQGGGGSGGTATWGINGNRGLAGDWLYDTLERDADFTGNPTLTITVNNSGGQGGGIFAAGSAGATSSVSGTNGITTLSAPGGAGGSGIGGNYAGEGAGNIIYQDHTYVGGTTENTVGAAGNFPGGGGAGGGYLGGGGHGADAEIWIRLRQS